MADIGPAGEDQGMGGKYLLLPPDFKGETPPGYFLLRYPTYNGYALYRAIRNGTTDADAAAALALVKKLRVYPLAQATNPPEQRFIDIYGKTFDGIANFDERFFESLNRMVQEEPVLPRDMIVMGMLKSIGIEKGKDFKPDAATQSSTKVRGAGSTGALHSIADLLQPPVVAGSNMVSARPHGRQNGVHVPDRRHARRGRPRLCKLRRFCPAEKDGNELGVSLYLSR